MTLAALLAERHRRATEAERGAVDAERYRAIAADLRSWYHPRQAAFLSSKAKRRAALCTRRSGKTAGICREYLARAFELPGHRLMYVNEVRDEARRLFWRADTKQGVVDVLERLELEGKIKIGQDRRDFAKGADVKIDEQALTVDFRNGSQIRVFAADDERAQNRARGAAPHVVTVDEAQKYPRLREFAEEVVGPSLKEHKDPPGELWLTGTPSEFFSGLFYSVTANDSDESRSKREQGWEVHEWSVTDNPRFGDTPEERWEQAIGEELREKGIDPSNPPEWVAREWKAVWSAESARFVYWVHRAKHVLTYAPMRYTPHVPNFLKVLDPEGRDLSGVSGFVDRWYDHEASVKDLPLTYPGTNDRIAWQFALGADFGYDPHAFGVAIWAFCSELPDLYEMWSWKRTRVIPDYQRDCLLSLAETVPLSYMVGDPGGQAGSNMEGWRQLAGLQIEDAAKSSKATWQELFNSAIVQGYVHFREGSPMLHEMKHLTWKQVGQQLKEAQDRKLSDGTVPGSDVSDPGLYAARWIIVHRPEAPKPPIPHGTPEWYAEEERKTREAAMQYSREAIAELGVGGVEDWSY